jgi:hypothetical protein
MTAINLETAAYDSSETVGLSLALGPTMTVGRTSCCTILTCTCGELLPGEEVTVGDGGEVY